ncbi:MULTISPECIES: LacI family DNA-binding transcriptional regulator [unclassified Modestobacter]|uniref:LacI family DNA-binding transcriptional regulator n=1 Tax=unclassified Modestobacter TaxID=2643866 RepID=UPI0022AA02C5|nr:MULTISPECIES: LacI family DNA-binding transcriptional regulator [unclassified Modestobacter]MCZ2812133.1 LacI family DNA-binding transcriptional regulator [Modestobacter sp. VKM Ac-2979]MCZ2843857.1 LacI family DNA-binding transcriptional regulator [Modestobacter sp. VKM Ac-2980]MCZ2849695.1 LacI family DNA-binding transcriptional regulator [Modestobacter sp. VKM Ac-2978]
MPPQQLGRPTLASIAAAAGVSLPTVSKVVNGKTDVAPATRAHVQQLLEEHKYVPVARKAPEDLLVDVVFTALDSPWAVEILRGVTESGLDVVVSSQSRSSDTDWVGALIAGGRRGALVVTSRLTAADQRRLGRSRLPVVVIDPVDMPGQDVPSVGATNWAGGLAATEHLVGLGHRRIAVIGGPQDYLCSRARIDGYRAALERAGIAVDPELVRHGTFRHQGGYDQTRALLALPEPPTAVFAGSDEQAFGVMEAARQAGLSVPGDLSVVGFDDLPMARWSSPPLTTVCQPLADMGRLAGRMLHELIDGGELSSQRVELATHLVTRASTAAPRR